MPPLFRLLATAALAGCTLNAPVSPTGPARAGLSPSDSAARFPEQAVAARPTDPTSRVRVGPSAAPRPAATRPAATRRLPQRDVTRAIARAARRIIDAHGREPFGTEIPFEADGRVYIARIERHYHPPGGEKRPWGPHPGVSVFVSNANGAAQFAGN
jgi:hypothetical protein